MGWDGIGWGWSSLSFSVAFGPPGKRPGLILHAETEPTLAGTNRATPRDETSRARSSGDDDKDEYDDDERVVASVTRLRLYLNLIMISRGSSFPWTWDRRGGSVWV